MRITRIYSDDSGQSRFEDIEIELSDSGDIGSLSKKHPVRNVIFRETHASYDYDWHPAPERQYIVLLEGKIEIEVSTGEKRAFTGGDVLLVEDTKGRGHKTKTTDGKARRSIFITLE